MLLADMTRGIDALANDKRKNAESKMRLGGQGDEIFLAGRKREHEIGSGITIRSTDADEDVSGRVIDEDGAAAPNPTNGLPIDSDASVSGHADIATWPEEDYARFCCIELRQRSQRILRCR